MGRVFKGKYFPETAMHAKAQEFLELKQGATIVMDYVARFTELAYDAPIPGCPLTTRQPAEIYISHVVRPIHV